MTIHKNQKVKLKNKVVNEQIFPQTTTTVLVNDELADTFIKKTVEDSKIAIDEHGDLFYKKPGSSITSDRPENISDETIKNNIFRAGTGNGLCYLGETDYYNNPYTPETIKTKLATAKKDFKMCACAGKVYAFGGDTGISYDSRYGTQTHSYSSNIEVWDKNTQNSFRFLKSLPSDSRVVNAIAYNNFIYIVNEAGNVYQFDTNTETIVSIKINHYFAFVAAAAIHGNTLYILDRTSELVKVNLDNIENQETIIIKYTGEEPFTILSRCGCAITDKYLYLFGGVEYNKEKDIEKYVAKTSSFKININTGEVFKIKDFTMFGLTYNTNSQRYVKTETAVEKTTAILVNNSIWLFGGYCLAGGIQVPVNQIKIYDIAMDEYHLITRNIEWGLKTCGAVGVCKDNNIIYLAGGGSFEYHLPETNYDDGIYLGSNVIDCTKLLTNTACRLTNIDKHHVSSLYGDSGNNEKFFGYDGDISYRGQSFIELDKISIINHPLLDDIDNPIVLRVPEKTHNGDTIYIMGGKLKSDPNKYSNKIFQLDDWQSSHDKVLCTAASGLNVVYAQEYADNIYMIESPYFDLIQNSWTADSEGNIPHLYDKVPVVNVYKFNITLNTVEKLYEFTFPDQPFPPSYGDIIKPAKPGRFVKGSFFTGESGSPYIYYSALGANDNLYAKSIEKLDLTTGELTQILPMYEETGGFSPFPSWPAAVIYNNYLILAGGTSNDDDMVPNSSYKNDAKPGIQLINLITLKQSFLDLPEGFFLGNAIVANNILYLAGGYSEIYPKFKPFNKIIQVDLNSGLSYLIEDPLPLESNTTACWNWRYTWNQYYYSVTYLPELSYFGGSGINNGVKVSLRRSTSNYKRILNSETDLTTKLIAPRDLETSISGYLSSGYTLRTPIQVGDSAKILTAIADPLAKGYIKYTLREKGIKEVRYAKSITFTAIADGSSSDQTTTKYAIELESQSGEKINKNIYSINFDNVDFSYRPLAEQQTINKFIRNATNINFRLSRNNRALYCDNTKIYPVTKSSLLKTDNDESPFVEKTTESAQVAIDNNGNLWYDNQIKLATEVEVGGIKASEKTAEDTQEVKIDSVTGKLFTKACVGGLSQEEVQTLIDTSIGNVLKEGF